MQFSVQTVAPSRALASLADVKADLGLVGVAEDAILTGLILQASDMIAHECAVRGDGIAPPTFLRETIVQTFRPAQSLAQLILARRFVSSISTIVVDGAALMAADYECRSASGLLYRLDDDEIVAWRGKRIDITYQAGFQIVPEPLKRATIAAVREMRAAMNRDPLVKTEKVDGIGEQQFWIGGIDARNGSAFSSTVLATLSQYHYGSL
jgi:hypothetical protein